MATLPLGKSVRWNGQARDAHGVDWRAAFRAMWPQCAAGAALCGSLYFISPLLLSLPWTAGCLLAVPFAVATAHPWAGKLFQKAGLCGVPEDFDAPGEIEAVRAECLKGLRPAVSQRASRDDASPKSQLPLGC